MTRIGAQKMQKIIQILDSVLPQAADVCSAAEFLILYVTRETNSTLPLLLGQRTACRPELSLLETFTTIRPANPESDLVS
jgi:hypothetical protein